MLLFALAALAAAGGFLLYYASQHPMLVSTEQPPSAADPQDAPPTPSVSKSVKAPPKKTEQHRVERIPPTSSDEKGDPNKASEPVQTAQYPATQPAVEKKFQALMSSGMAALQRGDYYVAQDAFIQAKNIQPDSPEVKDALTQVDAAIRLTFIADLEKAAITAEQDEHWNRALNRYVEVLKIDGTLWFALEGKTRARERLRMDRRLQYYLEQPGVLASESHIQQAVDLVEKAAAISSTGPRLRSQIDRLQKAIRIAKTPVKVTLQSDNATEVAVYRVGKFGRFTEKELHLRPGTYTVVGTREGYKDVRQILTVSVDDPPLHVIIRCEETL